MKNVVIISSSMRKGNSDILCDEFVKGLKENLHNVTKIDLRNLNLKFCIACSDCYNVGRCTLIDDMNTLYDTIKNAEIIVLATPIYFGSISGQMKVFIDRLYPIFTSLKAKEIYVIATCYQNSKEHIDNAIIPIKQFASQIKVPIKQIIYGENTDEAGDVTKEQCNLAYNIGKTI